MAHFGLFFGSFGSFSSPLGLLWLVLACFYSFWIVFAHIGSPFGSFGLFCVALARFGSF